MSMQTGNRRVECKQPGGHACSVKETLSAFAHLQLLCYMHASTRAYTSHL